MVQSCITSENYTIKKNPNKTTTKKPPQNHTEVNDNKEKTEGLEKKKKKREILVINSTSDHQPQNIIHIYYCFVLSLQSIAFSSHFKLMSPITGACQ